MLTVMRCIFYLFLIPFLVFSKPYTGEIMREMAQAGRCLFFVGHARSGHSIVGSIINAHPHAVVADEIYIKKTPGFLTHPEVFLREIWKRASSYQHYAIEGLFQGTYEGHIDLIGNKLGMYTTEFFANQPLQALNRCSQLITKLQMRLQWIHVQRNPFDNIATLFLRDHLGDAYTDFVREKKNLSTEDPKVREGLRRAAHNYFDLVERGVLFVRRKYADLHTLYHEDFIAKPKEEIERLCDFLGLEKSSEFLEQTSARVMSKTTNTRERLIWDDKTVNYIRNEINKYPWMERYQVEAYGPSKTCSI